MIPKPDANDETEDAQRFRFRFRRGSLFHFRSGPSPGKISPPRAPGLRAQGEERVQTFLQVLDDGHDVHVRRVVQCLRNVPSQKIAKLRR